MKLLLEANEYKSISIMDPQKPATQINKPKKPQVNFSYQTNAVPSISNQIPNQYPMQMPLSSTIPTMPINLANNEPVVGIGSSSYAGNTDMQYFDIPQQQQISNSYNPFMDNNFNAYGGMGHHTNEVQINLLNHKEEDKNKKVVAVVVSFVTGGSYDNLFTTVEQKSQQGTKVLVYSCTSNAVQKILRELKGQNSENDKVKQMVKQMKQLDSDCVVFNWECCSGYGPQFFPEGKEKLFDFVKFVIDRGHMVMFSDFSLKALIHQWDASKLGPNPFKKMGETSSPFELHFEAKTLIECPSAQLQIIGEMSQSGKCHVEAMGGTIVYSVNKHIKKNDFYTLQVLTVAETDLQTQGQDYKLEIKGKRGLAGHVLLTYKSGGHLLTSMGHWIELMKIDTSQKKLFEVAQKQYGAEFAEQMKYQYNQMGVAEQRAYISSNAVNFVQNQAPCSNMMSKAMYSKKG